LTTPPMAATTTTTTTTTVSTVSAITPKTDQVCCILSFGWFPGVRIQTPGDHLKERKQHSEHGKSLKSRTDQVCHAADGSQSQCFMN
jgi:hypothetical protein